jgi:uncharacterized membrane protein YqjE
MTEGDSSPSGIFASLRRMLDTALSTVQNRVELFALELQEEKSWLISTLLWAAAMIFFGGLAIIFVVAAIIFLAPEAWRPWVLLGIAVAFVWLAANSVVGFRRSLRDKRPPLSDTIGELKKDIEWIRSRD